MANKLGLDSKRQGLDVLEQLDKFERVGEGPQLKYPVKGADGNKYQAYQRVAL